MYIRPLSTCISWLQNVGNISTLQRCLHTHHGRLWANARRTGLASKPTTIRQKVQEAVEDTKTQPRKLKRSEVNKEMKTSFSRLSIYKKLFTKPMELFRKPHVNLPIRHREVGKLADDPVHQSAHKRASEVDRIKKQEAELKQTSETIAEEDWQPLYQQPASHMLLLRLISRAKVLQVVFMMTACPYANQLLQDGILSEAELAGLVAANGLLMTALSLVSAFSTKLIQQLAYNKEHDLLRISRLTFLVALKRQYIVPANRVIPFLERATHTDLTHRVQRLYITDEHGLPRIYYFSLARGRVIEAKKFHELLVIPCG